MLCIRDSASYSNTMHIAIDGYEANVTPRVGIGRYAYEILLHLHEKVKSGYKNFQFTIYLPSKPLSDMPMETEWWHYEVVRPSKLWTFIGLPLALMRAHPRPDVVFSPTHYIPRFVSFPRVMAIMDVSYLSYPELFRPKDLHQLVHWTKYSARHAAHIFTISDNSRRAIIKAYRVPETKVTVTYPGFSMDTTTKPAYKEALQKKYSISSHYILSVGTLQPRKNFVRLVEAFSLFLKENKQKFDAIDLVIVGKKGWLYEEILAAPLVYGVSDRVKFLDFVPDFDLPGLYHHALCFALPSLYEGFGLPVLEAMAYECPVVVSNVSSLPEIAGKAGIYVDSENVASIKDGLLTAVRQRNLVQGKARIKQGKEQVKEFTWEDAARKTLTVLEEVGKKN